jgi:SAM-dependent methyltransferase
MTSETFFKFSEVFDVDEYLYFYEDTLSTEDTPAQVSFIECQLELAPGASVVDLGCGHGRHANELTRRGYKVLGVDLVPGFIAMARAAADRERLIVDYSVGDVRGLGVSELYDHAICLFDSFGFLDEEGNADVLRSAYAALRPGGSLLLDVRNRDWVVRSMLPVTVLDKGDDLMVDRHYFDSATGRLVDRRTLVRAGHARHVTFSVRLYSVTELSLLLKSTGFVVERSFGGWDGLPVSLSRNRLIIVARRP